MRGKDIPAFLALIGALAACGGDEDPREADGRARGNVADAQVLEELDPSDNARAEMVVDHFAGGGGDFRARSSEEWFRALVRDFELVSGGARVPVDGLPGAAGLRVDHARAEDLLADWQARFVRRGAFVFRYDQTYGYDGERDGIIVLPTTDKYAVVRAAGTNAVNYGVENRGVIRWLRRLDRRHPFVLTGAGTDFVEGYFEEPVRDPMPLARFMYRICPDIVDQGTGTVRALARELAETQTLFLWWD